MDLEKIPETDMWSVSKSARKHRRVVLGFVPKIGLPIVDYGDVDRIDSFYLECQDYRDYYRDPYDKLHKPIRFVFHQGKCGIRLDTSIEQLRQPMIWVPKRLPPIRPLEYRSYMNLGIDAGEIMKGRHNKASCNLFKR
ncbi:hypothetical protein AWZ03_010985 [Drosophila navojoa]|uniref:Uncharacterized protein n=1 Tax=Drosophila navojoa TaxID=7232 RepID=A0A484B3F9_DRONA|nr:uncharacterized protein LOC115563986 [Drosophila navojoa]TDG42600.1 hypothetical protein AWZ03_010985 [Drosophila navojoa]